MTLFMQRSRGLPAKEHLLIEQALDSVKEQLTPCSICVAIGTGLNLIPIWYRFRIGIDTNARSFQLSADETLLSRENRVREER
jgi:hypothetical protein